MNDTPQSTDTPAGAVAPAPGAAQTGKLDDVLLAMDVVDTLRHRERIVDLALNAEARETQLIARLRQIYQAQGIDAPEHIIREGVKALAEQRFVYKPPAPRLAIRLARLYVKRRRWLPGTLTLLGIAVAALIGWQVFVVMPQAADNRQLPQALTTVRDRVVELAVNPQVDADADALWRDGLTAVDDGNRAAARSQLGRLQDLDAVLREEFEIRIVARPGETTGFYREPLDLPGVRNHYLIVEAVTPDGRVLPRTMTSEEDQDTREVRMWGQRVTAALYNRVAADKGDDQIVQDNILGRKVRGELQPTFGDGVMDGVIFQW